ncbi:amino acid/amide ABC transporter membrane protein 1, HAAT family [Halobiforma haloterrestris]|uniref:Amino acid/amide ABC transporter membrane protein 1, HAAT family n=1 Tax=Natronobacterium haloterrestre TaxID=148448 RepID=A0A1I1FES5_NATHA|nr:branched-chain amino acid ABC transporter permease [Halobiforma haloterrestris]SFB97801.1 amino acid/amide ABC transporter membrane protein 1, HAAT family [Halobiforma haloterrestris]
MTGTETALAVAASGVAPDVPLVVDAVSRLFRPDTVARILIEGLGKASIYFIIAVGLTLVFGLMGVLNFAHGAFAMLGAYAGGVLMVLAVSSGTGPYARVAFFVVVAAVVFALMTAVGSVLEIGLVRPIYDRTPMYQILLTFGVGLILEEGARIATSARGIQPEPTWTGAAATIPNALETFYSILGASIRGFYMFAIVAGVAVAAAVWAFLNRTLYGLYIRAGSEDPEMVEALGIDVRKAFTVVFGLGTGLAAVGGVFLMWDPTWGPSVLLNIDALLYAFVVVVIGGLGSFKGTLAAAVIVGIADSFTTWLFNTGIVAFPGLPEVTIFALLVIVLIVRPQGLYGVEEVGGH